VHRKRATSRPRALVACGHVHQYRETWSAGVHHVWGTSTAFIVPDHRQPRWELKEVGYVEHRLEHDGMKAVACACRGVLTLDIADFPAAYGPIPTQARPEIRDE
jgi:hypothetical protein